MGQTFAIPFLFFNKCVNFKVCEKNDPFQKKKKKTVVGYYINISYKTTKVNRKRVEISSFYGTKNGLKGVENEIYNTWDSMYYYWRFIDDS